MPTLQLTLEQRAIARSLFRPYFREQAKGFLDEEKRARELAAQTATAVSRASIQNERPLAPPRAGRSHSRRLRDVVEWGVAADGVELDIPQLDAGARYWIIQEIGTGQRATLRQGGVRNPVGRPSKSATHVRTVKPQRGRAISSGLAWATGPTGTYTAPGAATGQQLHLVRRLKGVPFGPHSARTQMRITREIRGKHFARKGGEAAAPQYRKSVLESARRRFGGFSFRP